MKKILLILALMFTLNIVTSCSSDNDESITPCMEFYVRGNINGIPFEHNNIHSTNIYDNAMDFRVISIHSNNSTTYFDFDLNIFSNVNYNLVNTYDISMYSSNPYYTYFDIGYNNGNKYDNQCQESLGTITITYIDNDRMEGNFNMTLVKKDNSNPCTENTNISGSFNVELRH